MPVDAQRFREPGWLTACFLPTALGLADVSGACAFGEHVKNRSQRTSRRPDRIPMTPQDQDRIVGVLAGDNGKFLVEHGHARIEQMWLGVWESDHDRTRACDRTRELQEPVHGPPRAVIDVRVTGLVQGHRNNQPVELPVGPYGVHPISELGPVSISQATPGVESAAQHGKTRRRAVPTGCPTAYAGEAGKVRWEG